jgi:hypothetical protein
VVRWSSSPILVASAEPETEPWRELETRPSKSPEEQYAGSPQGGAACPREIDPAPATAAAAQQGPNQIHQESGCSCHLPKPCRPAPEVECHSQGKWPFSGQSARYCPRRCLPITEFMLYGRWKELLLSVCVCPGCCHQGTGPIHR